MIVLTYEHAAAAWKSVNRSPSFAIWSILGVRISPPKQPTSEKPRSSATMTRKLGRLAMMNDSSKFKLGYQNRIKESCRIEIPGQEKRKQWREKEKTQRRNKWRGTSCTRMQSYSIPAGSASGPILVHIAGRGVNHLGVVCLLYSEPCLVLGCYQSLIGSRLRCSQQCGDVGNLVDPVKRFVAAA